MGDRLGMGGTTTGPLANPIDPGPKMGMINQPRTASSGGSIYQPPVGSTLVFLPGIHETMGNSPNSPPLKAPGRSNTDMGGPIDIPG